MHSRKNYGTLHSSFQVSNQGCIFFYNSRGGGKKSKGLRPSRGGGENQKRGKGISSFIYFKISSVIKGREISRYDIR